VTDVTGWVNVAHAVGQALEGIIGAKCSPAMYWIALDIALDDGFNRAHPEPWLI